MEDSSTSSSSHSSSSNSSSTSSITQSKTSTSSSGYTEYCTSCNRCSTCSTSSSSSSSRFSRKPANSSETSVSDSALVSSDSSLKMHLIGANEVEESELRARMKDDLFIGQQLSQLVPGIENCENRFKVHQFTQSAMMLPDFNEYERFKPLIDGLVDELNPNDFLGCSAALEILAEIAASRPLNIQYFEQIGLLSKIYELFKFTKSNPDLGHPHIACIRFFGYLSTADPNSLIKFPLFTADVFDAVYLFDAFDPIRRKLAFETFAIITTSSGAKQFLSSTQCPHNMAKALNHLGAAVATGGGMPELKAAYLDSIGTIFDSFDPHSPLESPTILQNWFTQLGGPFPQLLFQCLKMPVDNVQNAALRLLLALFRHKWAPSKFLQIDGFIDFLLDREPNFSAIGYQLKHDFVCRLVDCCSNCPQIDAETLQKLREYVALGPYAPKERVEIATEEVN